MPLHRTCSQSFREKLLKEFPGLENNPCYWQHLNRLLYCSVQLVYHNFQSHRVMAVPISQKHVAFDFRAVPDLLNNRFIAIDYINLFRKEVYHYEIIDWNYKEHQCRYAVCDFPTYILQLVEDERDGLY